MKRVLKLAGWMVPLLLAPQLALAQWTAGQEGQLVIRGGWLFDSVSDERRPNTGIVIQAGKFVEVDAAVQLQISRAAKVVDLAESDTILPGMFDLHAHYNLDLVDKGRVEEVVSNGIVFASSLNAIVSMPVSPSGHDCSHRAHTSAGSVANTTSRRRRTIASVGPTTSPKTKYVGRWMPGPSKAS
jgi:hypothetical protein